MAAPASDVKRCQAYFCHASADVVWVRNFINKLESDKYGLRCAEYDRDCLGGKYVIAQIDQFMEDSEFIVIVLSPSFLEFKPTMFQLRLAVQFSLDNNEGNIIPLVYKHCDVPRCMKVFDPVHVTMNGWEKMFVQRLSRPARRFPKDSGITTRDGLRWSQREDQVETCPTGTVSNAIFALRLSNANGRISIEALIARPTRNVVSEPFLDLACNTLSEHNFNKVRTLSDKRRGKAKFLEERQADEEKRASLPKSARSGGEMVNAKRESDATGRISIDIQENLPPNILQAEGTPRWNRKRNSRERVEAEITQLDEKGGACANSLTVGAKFQSENCRYTTNTDSVGETTLQKGENGRKWNRATRNRRNADIKLLSACSVEYAADVHTTMLDENVAFRGNQNMNKADANQNFATCFGNTNKPTTSNNVCGSDEVYPNLNKCEVDFGPRGRSVCEEENMMTFHQSLVLLMGNCAKNVRIRHGLGKTRIDADMLPS